MSMNKLFLTVLHYKNWRAVRIPGRTAVEPFGIPNINDTKSGFFKISKNITWKRTTKNISREKAIFCGSFAPKIIKIGSGSSEKS